MENSKIAFTEQDFQSLRAFIKKEIMPFTKERDETEMFPLEVHRKLHSLGFSNCIIPSDVGGMGVSTLEAAKIFREIAYASPGVALSMAGNAIAVVALFLGAPQKLREEFARDYLDRFSLSSFCFTEPNHGSDVLRIETRAEKVPGGYRLTGQKCFVTSASYAERYLVVAKIENGKSPKQAMGLFLIDKGAEGLSTGSDYQKLGLRESSTGEVFLENVFVPDNRLVGAEGEGFPIACRSIQRSRIFLSACAVGICDRIRDLTTDYLKQRVLYDKPLLAQPAITNQLGQLLAEKEAVWGLIKSAAESWDGGDTSFVPSSMAKLLAGQLATKFSSAGVELFGAWGCTKDYEIERIYRDAKFFEIMEGANFVQLAIMGKELFPLPQGSVKKKVA